ncbi:hypothetical protein CHU98_g4118 [Xylaria longipes]|nr:hypothetical protein CHU98_g4118 [Xylaria longipes]
MTEESVRIAPAPATRRLLQRSILARDRRISAATRWCTSDMTQASHISRHRDDNSVQHRQPGADWVITPRTDPLRVLTISHKRWGHVSSTWVGWWLRGSVAVGL